MKSSLPQRGRWHGEPVTDEENNSTLPFKRGTKQHLSNEKPKRVVEGADPYRISANPLNFEHYVCTEYHEMKSLLPLFSSERERREFKQTFKFEHFVRTKTPRN